MRYRVSLWLVTARECVRDMPGVVNDLVSGLDPATGMEYFYNPKTGVSGWTVESALAIDDLHTAHDPVKRSADPQERDGD